MPSYKLNQTHIAKCVKNERKRLKFNKLRSWLKSKILSFSWFNSFFLLKKLTFGCITFYKIFLHFNEKYYLKLKIR